MITGPLSFPIHFLFVAVYCFVLFFNFLAAMALLIKGPGDSKMDTGATFGLSALYLIANVPLSFIGWYRPCYRAFKYVFCFPPACRTANVGHFPSCPHISHLDTFTEDLVYKFGITLIAQL